MSHYWYIILRSLFFYFVLLAIFRIMGKREIGELSILDLVVFIMIADMAVLPIEDTEKPIFDALLPMILLLAVQVGLAFISLKSVTFRHMIDGKPSIIIDKGKIDEKEMRRLRYNFDDLLTQLRQKNIINVSDVEYAILEPSGKLSVIEKRMIEKESAPYPLIVDGTIIEETLVRIHKTAGWLQEQISKKGYRDVRDISLCTYDNGQLYIDKE
ncbi:DUF421 domain-containing protein [Peribacillus sp. SCS-155]|uniref:DUF421 domain-containing protein n=1 Tax=Peribacillus sedimenti TaxID=3115297 RepID=UPI003906440D